MSEFTTGYKYSSTTSKQAFQTGHTDGLHQSSYDFAYSTTGSHAGVAGVGDYSSTSYFKSSDLGAGNGYTGYQNLPPGSRQIEYGLSKSNYKVDNSEVEDYKNRLEESLTRVCILALENDRLYTGNKRLKVRVSELESELKIVTS